MNIQIDGFEEEPKLDASGNVYRGRLDLSGVQWTGVGAEAFATITITADQLTDAAENRLIWTDQTVQRGVNPTAKGKVPKELALAEGYPEKGSYIFDAKNADEITEKLLNGERLFLNPLVWNLRPGSFSAYWDSKASSIYVYSGKIYLPDSHHRHQAILKAVRTIRDHPGAYSQFKGDRQFKIELYFLDRDGEGNYFFDKNQRPKPTAKSKAYDLTTNDDLSVLAKRLLEKSSSLSAGVNRVTDRLSRKSTQFVTLATLREVMRTYAGVEEIDEAELEGLATVAAQFIEMLARVRPEYRWADLSSRNRMRETSLADAPVTLHAFATLMKEFSTDLAKKGSIEAQEYWSNKLRRFSPNVLFTSGNWVGDFFAKANPIWFKTRVTKQSAPNKPLAVLNTGGARSRMTKVLKTYLDSPSPVSEVSILEAIDEPI
jgi:hypothetical protein